MEIRGSAVGTVLIVQFAENGRQVTRRRGLPANGRWTFPFGVSAGQHVLRFSAENARGQKSAPVAVRIIRN